MNSLVLKVDENGVPSLKFDLTLYGNNFTTTQHIAKLFVLLDYLSKEKKYVFEQLFGDLSALDNKDILQMVYDHVSLNTLTQLEINNLPLFKPSEVDKNEKDN